MESNTYVESSVSSDTGAIGGGMSYSSDSPWSGQPAQQAGAPAMAAKQGAVIPQMPDQNRTDAETAKEANLSAELQEDYQNRTCAETEEAANAADQNAEPQENTPEEVSELTEADKATGSIGVCCLLELGLEAH